MSRPVTAVRLTPAERRILQGWVRSSRTEQRFALRAQIVLAAAAGESTEAIAEGLRVCRGTVSKWRVRFAAQGLAGLQDAARPGRQHRYEEAVQGRIVAKLSEPPPPGYAQCNGRLLAEALGDVSKHKVWRVLKALGISLQRRRSWCVSTDPEFAPKAADITGLYLDPPENAVVLCVDEKPQIQALERAQGWLRLPNGKALGGFSHGYKRNGTTTLFAALNVATGLVKAGHYRRRRRVEFLDFMNRVVAEYPGQEIHVILDNLNTHKPKRERWLGQHKNVHFHFTPTHATWLNQIECWFSILSRSALRGASFNSPKPVRQAIDDFIEAYHPNAAPFEWTKKKVHPAPLKNNYAELCN